LALNLCGRVGLLTDYIIIGQLLDVASVTMLFLTQRLAVLAQTQLQGIGNAAWAGLAELHARGERETFRRRLVELTNLIAVLGVAGLGPIVAYNRHFFALWMPGAPYGGDAIVLVAAANALMLGLYSLWNWCFTGTGQVRLVLPSAALGSGLNLVASVGLTWWLRDPIGPLLGTMLGSMTVNVWVVPVLLRRSFGVSVRELTRAVGGPLAWGVPYGSALWWLASAHRPWGWLGLAAETGLSALGFLVLAWFVLLNPTDRDLWRRRLAGLLPGWNRRGGRPALAATEDR
jgi:O-antigen/teichoic acid export membrane protein